ncbi:MAG: hypothetical protein IPL35_09830 [Sphingobacteriales bacterium]|nr:hypothetical protein [Sphingobacteriales bacterium]
MRAIFRAESYGIYTRSSLLVPTNQVRVGILDATDEQRNIFHNNTFDICSLAVPIYLLTTTIS